MIENLEWYLKSMTREIMKLEEGKFWGSVTFKLNWKNGVIANMDVGLNKSIRKVEKPA